MDLRLEMRDLEREICWRDCSEGRLEHACYALPFDSFYHSTSGGHGCIVSLHVKSAVGDSAAQSMCESLSAQADQTLIAPNIWLERNTEYKVRASLLNVDSNQLWKEVQDALIVKQTGYSLVARSGIFTDGRAVPASGQREDQAAVLCYLTTEFGAPRCPKKNLLAGKPYRGRCYYVSPEKHSFSEALRDNFCQRVTQGAESDRAMIAKVCDDDENQWLASQTRAHLGASGDGERAIINAFYHDRLWQQTDEFGNRTVRTPLSYFRWWTDPSNGMTATGFGDASKNNVATLHFSTNDAQRIPKFGYWETATEDEKFYVLCQRNMV